MNSICTVTATTPKSNPPITFSEDDLRGISPKQDDPVVISVEVANFTVKRMLIDQGSSTDILYWNTFKKLALIDSVLKPHKGVLVGFSGEHVQV